MKLVSTPTRYGAVAQLLHWLIAVLVVAAYLAGEGGARPAAIVPERSSALNLHETFGMLVLLALALQLLWRLIDHVPQKPPMPAWMALFSHLVRLALYLLMALVPLSAILGAWYSAEPITFIGIGDIGPFVAPAEEVGRALFDIHELLANAILIVAGLHAAEALIQHFVLRNRVLLSMLPFGRILSSHLAVTAHGTGTERGRNA